jgi:hypothetical protein
MCISIGYVEVGHEPLDIGLLELLAALHSAERDPTTSITQFIDASYVLNTLELVTRGISSLHWARLKHADILRRLIKAIFDRQVRGIPISLVKCAAHGRALSQSSTTTMGNSCADADAKATGLGGNRLPLYCHSRRQCSRRRLPPCPLRGVGALLPGYLHSVHCGAGSTLPAGRQRGSTASGSSCSVAAALLDASVSLTVVLQ